MCYLSTLKLLISRLPLFFSQEVLNENLETLHLARTKFIIYMGFILKQDFLEIILCPWFFPTPPLIT